MGSTYFHKRIPTRTYVRRPRSRPKTFKTEASAKTWAEKNGVKKYSLVHMNNSKINQKIKVVIN